MHGHGERGLKNLLLSFHRPRWSLCSQKLPAAVGGAPQTKTGGGKGKLSRLKRPPKQKFASILPTPAPNMTAQRERDPKADENCVALVAVKGKLCTFRTLGLNLLVPHSQSDATVSVHKIFFPCSCSAFPPLSW